MRLRLRAAFLAAAVALTACAHRPAGAPGGWPRKADWIVDGRTGQPATFDALIDDLASSDVVFLGEDHDNPHHHRMQRRIAEALLARRPDMAVGMEMLQANHQSAADRWVAGETTLEQFVVESDWKRTWG